jgi:hypothetical protein
LVVIILFLTFEVLIIKTFEMQVHYLLFAHPDDLNGLEDEEITVEGFEQPYEVKAIYDSTDWFEALNLVERYGSYVVLSEDEYKEFD